jgi:type III secretion protein N (ATPase)
VKPRPLVDFAAVSRAVEGCELPVKRGRITAVGELLLEAQLPGVRIGTRVEVRRPVGDPLPAEVAACDGPRVRLLPLASTSGVGTGDEVTPVSTARTVPCGRGLLGRVVDPAGLPLDGGPPLRDVEPWPLDRNPPDPLARRSIDEQLVTGLRAIDGCVAVGLGQRIGLLSGPGLGKTTLLGILARRASCDTAVICMVGERGREVREFVDRTLGRSGLARSIVVLATADSPPLVRARALETATAVAEWFRGRGEHVLLLVDSLTRVVRARRDVGLALGQAPARSGFPASAFTALPGLLERAGRAATGSITAVYAVLTDGDGQDPVAEEARALLDGHIALSARLARAGRWPAVDVLESVSRVMDAVVAPQHLAAAAAVRRLLGAYRENEDLILMGAYRQGSSPDTDLALARKVALDAFLAQGADERSSLEFTVQALRDLVRSA